jgi:hypothetical protein
VNKYLASNIKELSLEYPVSMYTFNLCYLFYVKECKHTSRFVDHYQFVSFCREALDVWPVWGRNDPSFLHFFMLFTLNRIGVKHGIRMDDRRYRR